MKKKKSMGGLAKLSSLRGAGAEWLPLLITAVPFSTVTLITTELMPCRQRVRRLVRNSMMKDRN
jgi:hypothetical protein